MKGSESYSKSFKTQAAEKKSDNFSFVPGVTDLSKRREFFANLFEEVLHPPKERREAVIVGDQKKTVTEYREALLIYQDGNLMARVSAQQREEDEMDYDIFSAMLLAVQNFISTTFKEGGLKTLQALSSLYAAHNQITTINPVAKLTKLWTLDLDHNQIEDLSPVAQLPRLDTLGLAHNKISDVSKLPPGNGMYATYLQGNQIRDISPLVKLAEQDAAGEKRFAMFWKLYLADNPIDPESKAEQLEALKKAGVRLNMEYNR